VATNASFALGNIIISVLPCPYRFPASIRETFFGPFSQLHAIIKD